MRFHALPTAAVICILALVTPLYSSSKEDGKMRVTIKTADLIASTAGPFSIALVLTDGGSIQDGESSVTVEHLRFEEGYRLGDATHFGGASGNIDARVILRNRFPVSFYVQSFHPGRELSFDLFFRAGKLHGGLPSRLSVFLLDGSGKPIASLAPVGDFFLGVDLRPNRVEAQIYGSNPGVLPYEGKSIKIPVPRVESWLCDVFEDDRGRQAEE